jgi:parallel beta-helix repeat protein
MREMKNYSFFVSCDGDDSWSGKLKEPDSNRTDGPFASIKKAKDAVRGLKKTGMKNGTVSVLLRNGFYLLQEPLLFTPEDSGSELLKIRYAAYENENPVISGGRKVSGWKEGKNGIWSVDVSEVTGRDGICRQMFINGKRRERTRIPNEGFYFIDGVLPASGQPLSFRFREGDVVRKEWADGNTEVIILENWYELRHIIKSIYKKTREITTHGYSRSYQKPGQRYRLENVKEDLTTPGRWFFDRNLTRIYYHPLPNEDMREADTFIPIIDTLLRIEGNTSDRVKNLYFSGLTFSHSAWTLSEEGYNDRQAACDISSAVQVSGAQECVFEGCQFIHMGGYGLEWKDGCINNNTIGCKFTDTGAGGIKIGTVEVYKDKNSPHISAGNTVKDCHIHDIGIVYPAAVGVWIGQSYKNTVSHNHIHDTYYTGISAGWTWGYGTSNAHGNIIKFNHIHDIGRGMLSDLGGIYTLGIQPDTVISYNTIHDIVNYDYGGWGIYLDEGTSNVLVENNLVYRTKSGGFHQHYGRKNTIRNNIFALSKEGQIRRTREEHHMSFKFTNNIVYCENEYPLCGIWSNNQYMLNNNLYFSRTGTPNKFLNPLIYIALKEFKGSFADGSELFDTVQIYPGKVKNTGNTKRRHLGCVPLIEKPQGMFPEEKSWGNALLLPEMVNATGQKVKNAETETRILRDKEYLYVKILSFQSKYSYGPDNIQENVEVFLKPEIADKRFVQILLKADGTKSTYYHPVERWQPFQWDGESIKTESEWRALLRIPIKKVEGTSKGKNTLWQIFIARYACLPDISFKQWQESGQDKNSIFADPLFLAPEKDNFRIQKGSPAFKIGFKPINL